jgi:serine/threonine protein phosphatase PrpC
VDHAPLAAEVAAGHLDAEVALASPASTKLTRALGIKGDSRVELNSDLTWASGDSFLICSDGFHGLGRGLPLSILRERLRNLEENEVRNPAESLVYQAVEADGRDNVTLVQVSITTGP